MVVSIVALLIGLLAPALASARRTADATICLNNLRQIAMISTIYADDSRGYSPALGVPWGREPFWARVVQVNAGESDGAYEPNSLLVCPRTDRVEPEDMTRTYAVNVTGLAGADGDRANYDEEFVHIRIDSVPFPGTTPWYLDSAAAPITGDQPPSSRTLATIDFRDDTHIPDRLGTVHGTITDGRGDRFNITRFDGSADAGMLPLPTGWLEPLP